MRVTTVSVEADRGGRTRTSSAPCRRRPWWSTAPSSPAPTGSAGTGWPGTPTASVVSLLGLLALGDDRSLPALLAATIEQVTDEHRHTCDPAHPLSPWAAIAVVRVRRGCVEHLVLGDATVVVDRAGSAPLVVTDPREVVISRSYLPALDAATDDAERDRVLAGLRARRNHPGGFWVAKDDPRAADEAVTGRVPVGALRSVALLSNGASRAVDTLGLTDWPALMAALPRTGPAEVVRRVRAAEHQQGLAQDDASMCFCTDLAGP